MNYKTVKYQVLPVKLTSISYFIGRVDRYEKVIEFFHKKVGTDLILLLLHSFCLRLCRQKYPKTMFYQYHLTGKILLETFGILFFILILEITFLGRLLR